MGFHTDDTEKPSFLIDLFPKRVPASRAEAYSAAEEWFLAEEVPGFARKVVRILLKLSCYFECECILDGKKQPFTGAALENAVQTVIRSRRGTLEIVLPAEDTVLTLDAGDLYLTVYHPEDRAAQFLSRLTASEGLFWRQEEESAEVPFTFGAAGI